MNILRNTLVAIICMLSMSAFAGNKTPYRFGFFGNIYNTSGGVANFQYSTAYSHWISDNADMVLNGSNDWRINLRSSDTSLPSIWVGPYASTQEINLLSSGNPGMSYNDRLRDTVKNWLYIYAKSYIEDTVSLHAESLVVHVADNSLTINQHGDGSRTVSGIQSLPFQKRRFTYQYWNNNSSDTAFYPMGYVWLANGYCDQTADAIGSAYYRAFVETPQAIGWPNQEWDCYYMDNHARRLSFMAYWDLTTSSGGQDEGHLEWIEGNNLKVRQNGGAHVLESQMDYFDNSVMKIDAAIHSRLMSGGHNVRGFANVYLSQPTDLAMLLPYVAGVTFESPIDYGMSWGAWRQAIASMDTMANHPDKYSFLEYRGDFLCQSSGWLSDTSRVIMYGYSFFLAFRSPGTFFGPHEVHQGDFGGDRRCWQNAFYVDLGEADSSWQKIDSTGVGDWTDKTMIIYRSYGNDAVILRTGYSAADFVGDYKAVNLHGLFREVDGWTGDTSLTVDSIFYLRPYEGKVLVAGNLGPCDTPPTIPNVSSPASGASVGTSPALCVTNSLPGICTDPVTYQFEIADDTNFISVVRQSGWIGQGVSTTCFTTSAALDNGRVYYWRSRASNGTSSSGWSTPSNFTTPNSPPSPPSGLLPIDQDSVGSLTPTLVINNALDPEGTPLVYYFEVCKRNDFSSPLAAQSGPIPQGVSNSSWQVNSTLENGSDYFWRSRAFDGQSFGPWSSTMAFTVVQLQINNPPPYPEGSAPADESTVNTLRPTLTITNVDDPDGDQLVYYFQVSALSNFSVLTVSSSQIASGSGSTSWQINIDLADSTTYYWRARAFDNQVYSPWSSTMSFTVVQLQINNPPPYPEGSAPADESTVSTERPILTITNVDDPDGDQLVYYFQVSALSNFSVLTVSSSQIASGSGSTSWQINIDLSDSATYYWRARAFDNQVYSPWGPALSFTVEQPQANNPPPYPEGLTPSHQSSVDTTQPTLVITNVTDPDGDELTYRFQISQYQDFSQVTTSSGPVSPGSQRSSWYIDSTLEDGITYYWRARAHDGQAYGHWGIAKSFNVDAPAVDPPSADTIYVASIEVINIGGRKNKFKAKAIITILTQDQTAAPAVMVDGYFDGPEHQPVSGMTGDDGRITFISNKVRRPTEPWEFHIDNLSCSYAAYDPESNNEDFGVAKMVVLSSENELFPNYPNPFNPVTTIGYSLEEEALVSMAIYNTLGQLVRTLVNEVQSTGDYEVVWDATDNDGAAVASGIYLYRFRAGRIGSSMRMILLK